MINNILNIIRVGRLLKITLANVLSFLFGSNVVLNVAHSFSPYNKQLKMFLCKMLFYSVKDRLCGLPELISFSLPSQMPTLPCAYRERDRERERLRRESETEEDEERERVLDEVSDGEESDDTAYDRRHAIPPSDLP